MRSDAEAEAQLARCCAEWWPRLVGAVSVSCDDTGHAEDIAQEARCRLVTRFDRTGDIAPLPWAVTVAMNLARSRLRRLRVERVHAARASVVPAATGAGEIVVDSAAVAAALRDLPSRQRTAVALRYLADLSVDDTATVMGCSSATVKSHVRDAFVALRAGPHLTTGDAGRIDEKGRV